MRSTETPRSCPGQAIADFSLLMVLFQVVTRQLRKQSHCGNRWRTNWKKEKEAETLKKMSLPPRSLSLWDPEASAHELDFKRWSLVALPRIQLCETSSEWCSQPGLHFNEELSQPTWEPKMELVRKHPQANSRQQHHWCSQRINVQSY